MSEVISLSTFHGHNLTDQDHALFMQTVTSQSGLFYGCEVTLKDENTLHVSTGEGIACGRIFRIMDMDYPVELSASGDLLGRLYVHIDTALDDTPAQLMDVQGSTLPALIQEDDMNQGTGVYEIELATFSINELGISNLEFTAPKATGGGAGGKSIAPDYVATESYEKGRIFFQNGTLYRTIAAIPAGAPLVLDTNVVETSIAAEIEALNQNLTKINPTTKTLWGYINGVWTDLHIRAYYDAIPVFVGGNFGIEVENGVYNPSTSTLATAFILQNDVMVGAPNAYSSLLSKDKIDFTNYTKVRTKIQLGNTVSELEMNVSGYNGEGYLAISTERRSSMMANGRAILEVTSTKTNFGGSVINNLIATADGTTSGGSVYFLEITIE